jgi:hypothetical protein
MKSRRHRDDGFSESSFLGRMMRPFRVFRKRGSQDDSIQADRGPLQRILSVLFFPLTLLGACLAFMVQTWATHRSGTAFLKGIPAVLAAAGLLAGLWLAGFLRESRSVNATRNYVLMHMNLENAESAEMFATKLVGLKPADDSLKYQLALLREENEKELEAEDLMSFIAPDERAGYANAHVWRSGKAMKQLKAADDPAALERQIVKHLELALEADPANQRAIISLADFYRFKAMQAEEGSETKQEFTQKAIEQLSNVVNQRGESTSGFQLAALPQLLQLLVESGRQREANELFVRIYDQYSTYAPGNADVFEFWLALIKSAVAVKDYATAQEIMDMAQQLITSNQTRGQLILLASDVFLQQASDFDDMQNRKQYRARLNAICRSLQVNPRNRRGYDELLQFAAAKYEPGLQSKPGCVDSVVGSAGPSPCPVADRHVSDLPRRCSRRVKEFGGSRSSKSADPSSHGVSCSRH